MAPGLLRFARLARNLPRRYCAPSSKSLTSTVIVDVEDKEDEDEDEDDEGDATNGIPGDVTGPGERAGRMDDKPPNAMLIGCIGLPTPTRSSVLVAAMTGPESRCAYLRDISPRARSVRLC